MVGFTFRSTLIFNYNLFSQLFSYSKVVKLFNIIVFWYYLIVNLQLCKYLIPCIYPITYR